MPSPANLQPPLIDEVSDALSRLSSADVAIAELKALVGVAINKGTFFDIVRATGVASSDQGAWTTTKVNESVQRLQGKRILAGDGSVLPGWRAPLVLRVVGRQGGPAMAAKVAGLCPRSWREALNRFYYSRREWPYFDADLARTARLMALAGDEREVERLVGLAETEALTDGRPLAMGSLLLGDLPADPVWLVNLAPGLRDRVCSAWLELLLDHGHCVPGLGAVIARADEIVGDWATAPRLDQALLRLDILGERADAARVRMARLKVSAPTIVLMSEAALAFLTNAPDAGLPLFRVALKQHRKTMGKRKIVLPGEFGHLHLIALFAANDVALHPEIAVQLEAAQATSPMLTAALECLLTLVSGQDHLAKARALRLAALDPTHGGSSDPLGVALTTLAFAVVEGAAASSRADADRGAAVGWKGSAPLAERILAETHANFPAAAGAGSAFWPERLASFGVGYPRRFLDIVPILPAWERALDKLQGFLAPPAPSEKAPTAKASKRLIFRLDAESEEITVLEQAAKGAGWTAGRPVALKRLHQRDSRIDYLSSEDEKALQAIKLHRDYYGDSYAFDPVRGPLALVGHPRVFDAAAPDRVVELVRYPAELVVRESRKGLHIDLSHRADSAVVFIEIEAPGRWRVIELTSALVALGEVLGPTGLDIPKDARERVIALIKTDNPRLPVRSELAGVATGSAKGDARAVLQIIPYGGGFHIRAMVRPLGESGPAYAPGQGSHSVLVAESGAHRRVERDLAGESAALELAAEACPSLAPWRDSDHDWRVEGLDAALEVLQELHAAGVGLEWPQGASLRPTRTVGAQAMSLNIVSGKDWFEVKGQIRVDEDLVLDMAQVLARLGDGPSRFIALDDGRYLALTEDLRRRLDGFAAMTESAKGGRRIGAIGAGALEELTDAAGSVVADDRWRALIGRLDAARGYEPQLPIGLDAELRDYQLQGFTWLARLSRLELGACLADDMGLGKTVQTLALLLADASNGPSLVIAPTSVCHNWLLEAARFTPSLRLHNLAGVADRAGLVERLGPGDVLVASYGLLHTEADLLASRRFAVAVFDEAHNLKNAETRRAQASKRIDAAFRLALTGTPIENRLDELWSLFDTITPGLLGSREGFQRRFSGPIEKGHGAHARQALKALVRPYLLRRTKAAVLRELPSRTEITLEIEPGPEERAFYESLRRRALETLTASDSAGARGHKRIRILAEITRLRRAACHPALIDPALGLESAKLATLLELTDELRAGRHRALVFSQFTGHLDLVEAALRAHGVNLLRLDGSTPAKERARLVEAFQAGEGELFLISLKAGGSGLNLTGADYVIHLDPWWNPAVEDQATDRAHRIGQTRPVTVYRLVSKDSIEESILALHAAKRTLTADFLEDAEAAGTLGEEALIALIRG